jgi:hypothetical protein
MFGWLYIISFLIRFTIFFRGRRGRDLQLPMQSAVPITIDFVSSNLDQGYRCTTLCDKICQWLATGQWFSPGPPVSSNNKTDRHDITEILLKVALNTINLTNEPFSLFNFSPKKRNNTFSNHYILIALIRFKTKYSICYFT